MAKRPNRLEKRQVILGVDMDGFEPAPQSPASNFIDVGAGYFTNESDGEIYLMALQAVGPFAVVTGAGRERWDLVYLDELGVAQIELGVEQVAPSPAYTGAPGNGAPFTAPDVWPVAYVYVDEAAGVVIDATDITYLRSYSRNDEKGVVGELAADSGAGVLGASWNRVPIDHQHPLNTDVVNPADVTAAAPAPGASGIYADRAHVHQMDAGLLASLSASRDRSSSMFWTPRTHLPGNINTNNYHWILHQFQGRAVNDDLVWFNVNVGTEEALTLWAVDGGGAGNNVALGGSDTTDPVQAAMPNGWLYVYIIGNPVTGAAALVYSTNVPSVGPGLVHAAFAGYTAWRVVTAIELDGTVGTPIAVPACKYDNTVLKIIPTGASQMTQASNVGAHAQTLYWAADFAAAVIPMSQHVSPLAMTAFLNIWLHALGGLGGTQRVTLDIDYDKLTPTAISPFGILGYADFEKEITAYAHTIGEEDLVADWFMLNVSQARALVLTITNIALGGGSARVGIAVCGYIENTDLETVSWDFTI